MAKRKGSVWLPRAWLALALTLALVAMSALAPATDSWAVDPADEPTPEVQTTPEATPEAQPTAQPTPTEAAQSACPSVITVEKPKPGESLTGQVEISGWAVDPTAPEGTGVTAVEFTLTAADGSSAPLGFAFYGGNRPEVGEKYGDPRFAPSGFTAIWDTAGVPAGTYTLVVTAHSGCGTATTSLPMVLQGAPLPEPFTATQGSVTTNGCMKIQIDLPLQGQVAEPPLLVVGYAYDPNATGGTTGVTEVKVFLGPKNEGKQLATLRYGLFRRDLKESTATEAFANAGFSGTLPPNGLPTTGDVVLYVYASGPCGEGYATVPVSLTSSVNQATSVGPAPTRAPIVPPSVTPATGTVGVGTNGVRPPNGSATPAAGMPTPTPPASTAPAPGSPPVAGGLAPPGGAAPAAGLLTAPTGLALAASAPGTVTLTWGASGGPVDSYEVFQSTDGTTYVSLGVVHATATTLSNLPAGNYYFAVAPRTAAGQVGPRSTPLGPITPGTTPATGGVIATGAPVGVSTSAVQPPTNLIFTSGSGQQSTLSWTASPTAGVTGYQVYASVNGSQFQPVGGPVAAPATSLTMQNLQANATYSFYVVALAGSQTSPASQTVGPCTLNQSCLGGGAVGPTGGGITPQVSGVNQGNRTALLTWTPVMGATAYKVYRSTSGQPPQLVQTVNAPQLQYLDVVPLIGSYSYYVTAVVNGVDSQPSNTITVNVT